jgi:ATP-binding cassette, subfamily B, multidrug efflux pump
MATFDDDEILGKAYDQRLASRLLTYVRPYRRLVLAAVALLVGASLLELLQPYLVKVAVDDHVARRNLPGVGRIALLYFGALLGAFVCRYVELYVMNLVGQRVMADLRRQLFAHLLRQNVRFYTRNPIGRLMTRVTSDVDVLNEMFTAGLVSILEDVLKLTGIMVLLLWLNWRLALATFAVLPLVILAAAIFRARVRHTFRLVRTAIAKINAFLQENLVGMQVVQLFNHEAHNMRRFRRLNREHLDAHLATVFYHALFFPAIELLGAIALALILWTSAGEIARGILTFGVLVAFIQYAQSFFRPISDLAEKYGIMQAAMASAERVFKLLDTDESTPEIAGAPSPPPMAGAIEFERVTFAYEGSEHVLKEVTFRVAAGERVAVVGATGAGKTTLVNLLLRFYDPTAGRVLIDGLDTRRVPLAWLRRGIGVVQQDVFLFAGSVADNISLGRPEIGAEQIEAAAARVNADLVIHALPAGYATPVREGGGSLSVGERQLLAFARALAYDPRILVLDEATSSVDTETEIAIQDGLEKLLLGRTALIIAHRLSTIRTADRILVMHHGELREQGSHEELLALGGIYAKLYELQYREQETSREPLERTTEVRA